jgi:hypothetical protein
MVVIEIPIWINRTLLEKFSSDLDLFFPADHA